MIKNRAPDAGRNKRRRRRKYAAAFYAAVCRQALCRLPTKLAMRRNARAQQRANAYNNAVAAFQQRAARKVKVQ